MTLSNILNDIKKFFLNTQSINQDINMDIVEKKVIEKFYKCDICNDNFDETEFKFTNDENKCILHCEKNDWYDKKGNWNTKKINYFWKKIQDDLNNIKEDELSNFSYDDEITYTKVIFPKFQIDEDYDFRGCDADLSSNFYAFLNINYEEHQGLNRIIENKKIVFDNCIFLDILDLRRYAFKKSVKFINPTFEKEILFNNTSNHIYEFVSCKFNKKIDFKYCGEFEKLSFHHVEFYKDANFMFTTFNFIEFIETKFHFLLNIFDCNINNYKLINITSSEIMVNNTIFHNQIKIPFGNSTFHFHRGINIGSSINLPVFSYDKASYIEINNSENISIESKKSELSRLHIEDSSLNNIKLQKKSTVATLHLRNVDIKNIFDIGGLHCSSKIDLENISFGSIANFLNIKVTEMTRETARIIKDSFEQQNNIIEANRFYALEMKEREKELTWKKDFFEKLVFKFHGISSNHSQNWLLALFWIIVIGMLSSTIDFLYFSNEPCVFHDSSITNLSLAYSGVLIFYYFIATYFDGNYFKTTLSLFALVPIYWYLTKDFLFYNFSKTINPFSIMSGQDNINGIQLIFKIIIGYLIYQLIISIRQNTRRK